LSFVGDPSEAEKYPGRSAIAVSARRRCTAMITYTACTNDLEARVFLSSAAADKRGLVAPSDVVNLDSRDAKVASDESGSSHR